MIIFILIIIIFSITFFFAQIFSKNVLAMHYKILFNVIKELSFRNQEKDLQETITV